MTNENQLENKTNNVPIKFDIDWSQDTPKISARALYDSLSKDGGLAGTERFSKWMDRYIRYGFKENEDFSTPYKKVRVQNEGNRIVSREVEDYDLSIDMAKQICMLQRNELGMRIRQYFLNIEKLWNSPEQILARAMKILQSQNEQLQSDLNQAVIKIEAQKNLIEEKDLQIDDMKPKADKYDTFINSKGSIEYKVAAKALGTTRNKMLSFLRDKNIINQDNTPRSYPYNKGYLIVKVSNVNDHLVSTTYVTATGIDYLYRFLNKHQIAYTSMYDPNFTPRPYEEFKEIVEELFEETE